MINTEIFEQLKNDLGKDVFCLALKAFADDLVEKQNQLLQEHTHKEFKKIAHSIKGQSLQFGFIKLSDVALEIEETNHIECSVDLKESLQVHINDVLQYIYQNGYLSR